MSDSDEIARLVAERDRLRRENEQLRHALGVDERRYQDLFDAAPDAYVVTDAAGKIVEANHAAEVLFGVPRRFLRAKPLVACVRPREAFLEILHEARSSALTERELTVRAGDGREVEVGVTASPLAETDAASVGIRWILRDISARRGVAEEIRRLNAELEERVRERTSALEAANRAKDVLLDELERRSRVEREFITNAAHELRTPVSAIASAVEVLEAGAKHDPEARDRFLAHAGAQSRRLQRLAYALLVLARAQMGHEPPPVEPLELAPLLADVVSALEASTQESVEIRCPGGARVLGNRQLVEQALLNVVQNATKYGGAGPVTIEAAPTGETVKIAFADSGPGMTADERRRALERFHRGADARGDGFGLGLSIAFQAIEALGGVLEIESEPERGTTVRMTLPAPVA
jgi:PAS domain S-box-containing protein